MVSIKWCLTWYTLCLVYLSISDVEFAEISRYLQTSRIPESCLRGLPCVPSFLGTVPCNDCHLQKKRYQSFELVF